jgi:hypothetical protein
MRKKEEMHHLLADFGAFGCHYHSNCDHTVEQMKCSLVWRASRKRRVKNFDFACVLFVVCKMNQ